MSEPGLPTAGDQTYQPISGLALGGLILSAAFTAMVALSAGVAIVKGTPIFYPLWLLIIPAAGFAVSLIARNQILASEGTRAGLNLTKWGLALALFSGLGYVAYFLTVGLAVASQANQFLTGPAEADSGFFAHLKEGGKKPLDLDVAFLLTRPPTGRTKIGDERALREAFDQPAPDGSAGDVSRFQQQLFVRFLTRAGDKAVIEPQGVREWAHERSSYKVARNYRIITPEGTLDLVVLAESVDDPEKGRRQWFVNVNRPPVVSRSFTPLGKAIEALRDQARKFVDERYRPRMHAGEFKDKTPTDETDWTKLVPDAPEVMKDGKNRKREYYRDGFREVFTGRGAQTFMTPPPDNNTWPVWGDDAAGHFWIRQPIRMLLGGAGDIPTLQAEGWIRLRTREPFDPASATGDLPELDWTVDQAALDQLRPAKGF